MHFHIIVLLSFIGNISLNIFFEYQKKFCLWLEKMSLTCQRNLKLHKKMSVDAEKWCVGNSPPALCENSDEIPTAHVELLLLYFCFERALVGRTISAA